jgi:hypothetical protein
MATTTPASCEWTPSSWRKFPAKQQAPYPDLKALKQAHDKCTSRAFHTETNVSLAEVCLT